MRRTLYKLFGSLAVIGVLLTLAGGPTTLAQNVAGGTISGTTVAATNLTNQMVMGTTNLTTLNFPAPSGAVTLTFPLNTGALPTGYSCGNALAAGGVCANTAQGGTFHVVFGSGVLSGSTSTITGISPAFTSTTSYWCLGNDTTTRANPVQVVAASASSITITNTTGGTDTISFICFGN